MPIYEYRCPDCDIVFSERRRMSEADDPVVCPECGKSKASRVLSLFAAHSSNGGVIAGSGGSCGSCTATSCSSCSSART
jgi:putative FmdB family regulatory protein